MNCGYKAIIFTANGDMRQAINILQTCAAGFNIVNEKNIYYIADIPHPQIIKDLIYKCINKNINEACNDITSIYKMGYSPTDIIGTIYNVSKSLDIPDEIKLSILKETGFIQLRISEGLNTLCQLTSLVGYLCKI